MFQVKRSPQVFDVVVIGSGAGGGTTVKVLTDLGIQAGHLSGSEIMASYLSEATMEWAGITSGHNPAILIPEDWDTNIAQDIPKVHPRVRSLGAVNDSGRHFKEIADLIEEQWESL